MPTERCHCPLSNSGECAAADTGIFLDTKCSFTYYPDPWPKDKKEIKVISKYYIKRRGRERGERRLLSSAGADLSHEMNVLNLRSVQLGAYSFTIRELNTDGYFPVSSGG